MAGKGSTGGGHLTVIAACSIQCRRRIGIRAPLVRRAFEALVTDNTTQAIAAVKMLPATGLAPAETEHSRQYTLSQPHDPSYPPGNVKVNNVMWPTTIPSDCTHLGPRDGCGRRLSGDAVGRATSPGGGRDYTLLFYNENNSLQENPDGLTTTAWTYLTADEATESDLAASTQFKVESSRARRHTTAETDPQRRPAG